MPRAIRNNEEKSQTKQKKKKKNSGSRSFVRGRNGLFLAIGQKYDRDEGKSLENKRESPPTTTTPPTIRTTCWEMYP
jgi:hypothetical protein